MRIGTAVASTSAEPRESAPAEDFSFLAVSLAPSEQGKGSAKDLSGAAKSLGSAESPDQARHDDQPAEHRRRRLGANRALRPDRRRNRCLRRLFPAGPGRRVRYGRRSDRRHPAHLRGLCRPGTGRRARRVVLSPAGFPLIAEPGDTPNAAEAGEPDKNQQSASFDEPDRSAVANTSRVECRRNHRADCERVLRAWSRVRRPP